MQTIEKNCSCGCNGNVKHHIKMLFGSTMTRVPKYSRQVIRDRTPPPIIERHVERAPTPEPDVIEKILIKPRPQRIHELIIERPKTPPPVVIEKEVVEDIVPETKSKYEVKNVANSGRNYAATVKLNPTLSNYDTGYTSGINYGTYGYSTPSYTGLNTTYTPFSSGLNSIYNDAYRTGFDSVYNSYSTNGNYRTFSPSSYTNNFKYTREF